MVVILLDILIAAFSFVLCGVGWFMVSDGFKKHEHDCAAVGAIVLAAGVAGLVVVARIAMGVV